MHPQATEERPGNRARERQELGESEVQRLLLVCSARAPTGVRNRALIALLYCSGLRLAEALALLPEDVLGDELHVQGGRTRRAHLFAPAQPYLETWIPVRSALDLAPGAPLFCTLKGAPLEPAYVRALLARLARRAGLARRVHAYLLRHSFAARLARLGLSAGALAQQLGHSEARTTERCLARLAVRLPAGPGARDIRGLPWSLAPQESPLRALVRLGAPRPANGPALQPENPGRVLVRRATFEPFPDVARATGEP